MQGGDSTDFGDLSGDEGVHDALADELGRLSVKGMFTVGVFDVDAVTIFEIFRDEHGTPYANSWEYRHEDGALQVTVGDKWSEEIANLDGFYRCVAPKFIVRTPQPLTNGLRDFLPGPGRVPVFECRAPLADLLRAVMRESPLVLGYELAVLKRVPVSGTDGTRLVLTGQPLFPTGETAGCQIPIQVSCEPTDAEGTAFAVVTREPRPELPRQSQQMRAMQIQAAVIPPGRYTVTAVLTRPGRVRLEGLPIPLARSRRSWDDLKRFVPEELIAQPSVHLVCLIEVCGADARFKQRIEWLVDLITEAQRNSGPLRVSVVAYGAHGIAWKVADKPPEIRAWAAPGDEAKKALRGLTGRRVDPREYPRAAQLECALKLVCERLALTAGRPVIVTAGGRPPHPPELDTTRQLVPCSEWADARLELGRLQTLPGIKFGALRDPKRQGGIWEQLGQHAAATVNDAVDMERFATDLGLRTAVQTVPFPVLEK